MTRICAVCDESLDDGTTTSAVKEKGLQAFVEASKKRGDGKVVLFKREKQLDVHEKCRKQYTKETAISAFLKRKAATDVRTTRGSIPEPFSFRTHCFICAKQVPPDYKKKQMKLKPSKHDPVHAVTDKLKNLERNVLRLARARNDEYGWAIERRIQSVNDLPAADAQYHLSCMKHLYRGPKSDVGGAGGRPRDNVNAAMEHIFTFLETNKEECQFTLDELMELVEEGNRPHPKTLRRRLLEKYQNDIIITSSQPYIICFKGTGHKILTEAWYQERLSEKEERLRIVRTAAQIIVEDARSVVHDVAHYPAPDRFLEHLEESIPESVRVFSDTVVMSNKKGNYEKWKNKSLAIADCLLTTIRPQSYVSPLQVGLSAFLYRKYGSRRLIDVLSSFGFCSTYGEAKRFEVSSISVPPLSLHSEALAQLVYDNADFNVRTIDGHNTFHSMGGIICVTPKSAVVPGQQIPRLKTIPFAETVGSAGMVPLQIYEPKGEGLATVPIKPLTPNFIRKDLVKPYEPHLVWTCSKHMGLPGVGGWNGFMEDVTRNLPYETTFIDCQPFINYPPSDYNTVLTALKCSKEKVESLGQQTTFVTFDQPLYLKAREIVACLSGDPDMQHIIIRLGGFHLLMSFMGAVGYIMDGSGLSDVFNQIFAAVSTEKVMTGHAYARAVRGHLLAHRALASLILKTIQFSDSFQLEMEEMLYGRDRSDILAPNEIECIKELTDKFNKQLQTFTSRGPTAKLWSQYFQMVTLIMKFIEAERTGNWNQHLETIHDMLPYFHASGHNLYAKCCHLYLQDMMELQSVMPENEFKSFTLQGGFTVRRTEKFRCGTWTDMSVEQELMKHLKSQGGLTRGRGTSDAILARWTLGMTTHRQVGEAIENFSGIEFATSEQHVDTRESRQNRDDRDYEKILEWFHQHPPFPDTDDLISLSSRVVGDASINCHMSKEIGETLIDAIVGKNFQTVKFKRNDRVHPLASMKCSVIVHDQTVVVNPTTLFQRMCVAKESDEELQEFLSYELSPFPLSLFDERGLRKGTKSSLYKAFKAESDTTILERCSQYVVDGGFLLHKVVWSSGQTFSQICDSYVKYVQQKYMATAIVVFDGYSEAQQGTKHMEHLRRSKQVSVEIKITDTMVPTVSKEKFLSNPKNKSRFIEMLIQRLNAAQIETRQAEEDADTLIVQTAASIADEHEIAIVVGEDVDLLVIMIGTQTPENLFFLKPGKGKIHPTLYHPPTTIDKSVANNILFLHAFSGCDATSAIFQQGKVKFLKTLTRNSDLSTYVKSFVKPHADPEEISEAGEKFLVALYGGDHRKTNLNTLRYKQYVTSAFKVTGNIAAIPPTKAAAHQHSLRAYHQAQQWLGNIMPAEEWGWKKVKGQLVPITTLEPPAPEKLLKLIACKCLKGCRGSCGCRRVGLLCSKLCAQCEGTCTNTEVSISDDDEDFEEPLLLTASPATGHSSSATQPVRGIKRKSSDVAEEPGPSTGTCYNILATTSDEDDEVEDPLVYPASPTAGPSSSATQPVRDLKRKPSDQEVQPGPSNQ